MEEPVSARKPTPTVLANVVLRVRKGQKIGEGIDRHATSHPPQHTKLRDLQTDPPPRPRNGAMRTVCPTADLPPIPTSVKGKCVRLPAISCSALPRSPHTARQFALLSFQSVASANLKVHPSDHVWMRHFRLQNNGHVLGGALCQHSLSSGRPDGVLCVTPPPTQRGNCGPHVGACPPPPEIGTC